MQEKKNYEIEEKEITAREPAVAYQTSFADLDDFFIDPETDEDKKPLQHSGLAPIIKWPGGKEKELGYIFSNLPDFERYFEPFVGGGSVFMAMTAKKYFINDFSKELITLYKNIADEDESFFQYAFSIDKCWLSAFDFFKVHTELIDLYLQYRNNYISKEKLKVSIKDFCTCNSEAINDIIKDFSFLPSVLLKEMEANLFRKMTRMKVLEQQKHLLPDEDLYDNIETAIKSAVYMNFRFLYNQETVKKNEKLHSALFLFIRNYAYSGMFRYSSSGQFNVPYGGIAYNGKTMRKKLEYYKSIPVKLHFSHTEIFNLDFEQFLRNANPTSSDFVFLDPPYDSEFSTYAQNTFTKDDQIRLADFMINECKAKWMLIIKNTDFIYNLYNRPGVKIQSFEKNYTVSFMNRNDRRVTHLVITNY